MLAVLLWMSAHACLGVDDVATFTDLERLVQKAGESRVVVLGEVHRTRAAPALLSDLLEPLWQRGFNTLAIEGQQDRQPWVDMFLAGTQDASALREALLTPDLADVVVRARALSRTSPERRPWRVLLIDGPAAWNVSTLEQSRDQRMFGHVRRALDDDASARVLVYVGNTHTTEGVRLRDAAEGPGHVADAIPIEIDPLAHMLDLYTGAKSLSVRTVGPDDPLGSMLKKRFPRMTRLVIQVDGSALQQSVGCVDPAGSFNEALRTAPLGVISDFVVVVPDHGVGRAWPKR